MLRSHQRNTSNMKDQASIFSPELTGPVEMLGNENDLDEFQVTELKKKKSISFTKGLRHLKKRQRNSSMELGRINA